MSACEKCWADASWKAHLHPDTDQADEYRRLVSQRDCTPEEKAGPCAALCFSCDRMALHQHTGECMNGCDRAASERADRGGA